MIMRTTERLEFETHTINRALQHDVVLYGRAGLAQQLVFTWRRASGLLGPRFDDRELAIDWMNDWLAYDGPSGDN
jgi:hypothetical protein